MLKNISGLVFTREDGRRITRAMIAKAMKRACQAAKVRDFRFHDLCHCAKNERARKGISVEVAMRAARHASPQMHRHYIHLQRSEVARAFGILSRGCPGKKQEKAASDQAVDFTVRRGG